MDIQRLTFLVVITSITFSLSILTARIYTSVLRSGQHGITIGYVIGIVFPVLFIVAMSASTLSSGWFTRLFATVIDVVGGIGFYFLITGALLGIALLITRSIGIQLAPLWGIVGIILSFLLAGIGIIQAQFINVATYNVYLRGAPQSWNGKRAVLVSDTHFGLINYENFSDKIVSKIQSLHPDFVLHAGDLYDGPRIDTAPISSSWKRLAATTPVFYAPGNHEEYGPYDAFIQSAYDAGFTVLTNKVTTYDGVQIAGITYHGKSDVAGGSRAIQDLTLEQSKPTILINHPPTFQQQALDKGVSLMVSGHTHNGQFWPLGYLVRAIYGRYTYGEYSFGALTGITTRGVGTAGPPMRLFNTPELVVITFTTQ